MRLYYNNSMEFVKGELIMKRTVRAMAFLIVLIACIGLMPVCGIAADNKDIIYSGECGDNAVYTLTKDGVLTVSGVGSVKFSWNGIGDEGEDGGAVIPGYSTAVRSVVIEEGITEIAYGAFSGFHGMTELSLPCTVTRIGDNAFSGCTGLTELTVPSRVALIGESVFEGCTGLREVAYDSSASIGYMMFYNCKALKKISFGGEVTVIGKRAFQNCTSLTDITLPDGVTYINDYDFDNCTSLERIELPKSLIRINKYAFRNCKKLKTVILPAVKSVNVHAFSGCDVLKDVYFPGNKEAWKKVSVSSDNDALLNAKVHTYYNYNYIPFCSVTTKYTKYGYTGKAVSPAVTVRTVSGTKLKKGVNYTVSYENNKKLGTATITVKGIGKYRGEKTYTFKIVPAKPKGIKVTKTEDNRAIVTWKSVPFANGYCVYVNGVKQGTTTKTTYTTERIKAGSVCKITVRGIITTKGEDGYPSSFYGNTGVITVS